MRAYAIAHPNLALVKYWGKRDPLLNIPSNGSIGLNLEALETRTSVRFDARLTRDEVIIDGLSIPGGEYELRFQPFLDHARRLAETRLHATVTSNSNFPASAGLASSSSGFAALAAAVDRALDLRLPREALSAFARRGSGSAARSVRGGFVEWHPGRAPDGSDCFATEIASARHWRSLWAVVCVVETSVKCVSSREAMNRARHTSPLYESWESQIEGALSRMRSAVEHRDFPALGELAEANALGLHATCLTASPPVIYWTGATLEVMKTVVRCRDEGIEAYFTIDAGPQVKVLCEEPQLGRIISELAKVSGVQRVIPTKVGAEARCIDEDER